MVILSRDIIEEKVNILLLIIDQLLQITAFISTFSLCLTHLLPLPGAKYVISMNPILVQVNGAQLHFPVAKIYAILMRK